MSSISLPPAKSSVACLFLRSQLTTAVPVPASLNLSGRTAVVTGSSSGLGYHACIQLLEHQVSHLILGVRSLSRGETAASQLRAGFPTARISVWELEMGSYASIRGFVGRIEKEIGGLDIAILNAGLVKPEFRLLEPGEGQSHEEVVQINYLSTVLLSLLLLPSLEKGTQGKGQRPGRLTIVGSGTALAAKFPNRGEVPLLASFDDREKWDPNERYWVSKLLMHYFLPKLAEVVNKKDVVVNVVDPGLCKGSELLRDVSGAPAMVMSLMKSTLGRKVEVGASTYLDAAVVKGAESHGCYVMDWKISPFAALVYAPDAKNVTDRLWDETMKELKFARPLAILESLKQ